MTPPYNKVVLGILVLLSINFIIACCGMSHNLNFTGGQAIAASALSFSLFTLAASVFIGYGAYIENGAPMLQFNNP